MLRKIRNFVTFLVLFATVLGWVLFAALPSKETKVPRSRINWANLQDVAEFARDFVWASQYFAVEETELGAAKRVLFQLEKDIKQEQAKVDETKLQADVELQRIGELEEKNKQINRKVAVILNAAELPEFSQATKTDLEKRITLGTKTFSGQEIYNSLDLYTQDIADNTHIIERTKYREKELRTQAENAQSFITGVKTNILEKLEECIFTIEKHLNPKEKIQFFSDEEHSHKAMDALKVTVDRIKVLKKRDTDSRRHQEVDAELREKNKQ